MHEIQPVPEKMRLEIVVGIEIGILDSQSLGSGFFLYEIFRKESANI